MNVNFRELEIYRLANELVFSTYSLLDKFPDYECNNLTSQLRRAVTCLPLNIAEGSGSRSYKIFLNYLIFCYRSCLECEAALYLSRRLRYINERQHSDLFEQLDTFVRKLYRYMEYVETKCGDRKKDKSYFYKYEKYRIDRDKSKRENFSRLC